MADEEEVEKFTKEEVEESIAKEMGWNPDFEGTDREKVDARTYILRSREIQDTMRKQLKHQGTEIKELGDQLSTGFQRFADFEVKTHKAKVAELNTEIAALKRDRKKAITDSDGDLAEDLDVKIDALKEQASEPAPVASSTSTKNAGPDPAYTEWHEKNPWFQERETRVPGSKETEMSEFADFVLFQNPGLAYDKLLPIIDAKMKQQFPDSFGKKKEDPKVETEEEKEKLAVAQAESGTKKSSQKSKFTRADLTDDQKSTADEFIQMGKSQDPPYTIEKYIESLVLQGVL